jgi:hypothetical protein
MRHYLKRLGGEIRIANNFAIVTEKLTLRPFNANDCEPMVKIRTSPKFINNPDGSWFYLRNNGFS